MSGESVRLPLVLTLEAGSVLDVVRSLDADFWMSSEHRTNLRRSVGSDSEEKGDIILRLAWNSISCFRINSP